MLGIDRRITGDSELSSVAAYLFHTAVQRTYTTRDPTRLDRLVVFSCVRSDAVIVEMCFFVSAYSIPCTEESDDTQVVGRRLDSALSVDVLVACLDDRPRRTSRGRARYQRLIIIVVVVIDICRRYVTDRRPRPSPPPSSVP